MQRKRADINNVISIMHAILASLDHVVKILSYETYTATIYSIFLSAWQLSAGGFYMEYAHTVIA